MKGTTKGKEDSVIVVKKTQVAVEKIKSPRQQPALN